MIGPPARTARRFEVTTEPDPLAIHDLLEHGDRGDLRWLIAQVGRETLRRHVEHFGDRLSSRSRQLWELLLETETAPPSAAARALWPLL